MVVLSNSYVVIFDPSFIRRFFRQFFLNSLVSGPSWNGPGSCLGECWRDILEDVGSKMMFLEASSTMLRDLGAKMANKSAKMIFTVCFSYLHCKSVIFIMCF